MPLKMEEVDYKPKNVRNAILEAGKGKEMDAHIVPPEEVQLCWCFDFHATKLISDLHTARK